MVCVNKMADDNKSNFIANIITVVDDNKSNSMVSVNKVADENEANFNVNTGDDYINRIVSVCVYHDSHCSAHKHVETHAKCHIFQVSL